MMDGKMIRKEVEKEVGILFSQFRRIQFLPPIILPSIILPIAFCLGSERQFFHHSRPVCRQPLRGVMMMVL